MKETLIGIGIALIILALPWGFFLLAISIEKAHESYCIVAGMKLAATTTPYQDFRTCVTK